MAEDKSKFPSSTISFKDTLKTGGITVRGFYLETDPDGFIEGPREIAAEIAPHGFVPEARPAASDDKGGKKK